MLGFRRGRNRGFPGNCQGKRGSIVLRKSSAKTTREKRKFWKELIEHIDSTWKKKKRSEFGYPFTGKDMADLRHFSGPFKEWGIMALWDEYLERPDEFNAKTGFSVFQFTRQLPFLVDVPHWKAKAAKYEMKLNGAYPENVLSLFDMTKFGRRQSDKSAA